MSSWIKRQLYPTLRLLLLTNEHASGKGHHSQKMLSIQRWKLNPVPTDILVPIQAN